MNRHRIVAVAPGNQYTIALVRFHSDETANKLAVDSVGKANAIIPTDISELVTYREQFALSGLTVARSEIGRVVV